MRAASLAAFLLAAAVTGCGEAPGRHDGPPPAGDSPVAAGGEAPDTSRAGPAFLALYRSGPLEEVRVVRATDGGLVVAGLCAFPEGTQVTLSLLAPGPGDAHVTLASVRARVEHGRFLGAPLAGVAGPPPAGIHPLRISAAFGPGDQEPEVLAAAAHGRRYHGPGVRELAGGRIIFETLLEVPL